uniref:Putative ovule protein n=1 Tax=Solanum chacoense TaxID=4108 RepID=A0A0V0ILU1_SOLCH
MLVIKSKAAASSQQLFFYYKGSFGTKINNAEISNAEIVMLRLVMQELIVHELVMHGLYLPSVWFIVSPHLVFGLKLDKKLLSNYTLELLCNWVEVNNCQTILFFYGLLTS